MNKQQITDLSFMDDCEHLNITEGFCQSCGLSTGPRLDFDVTNSDSHFPFVKNESKNYDTELSKIDCMSDKLKQVVVENLGKEKRPAKEASRKLEVFCQVYVAGAEMNELKPDQIAGSLKMSGRNLNKSLRVISGTSHKSIKDDEGQPTICPIVSISPIDCLKDICQQIDDAKSRNEQEKISKHYENMKVALNRIIKKSPSILNERPKYIAAGFVKYYCHIKNINIKDISSIIDLSTPTLNQYSSKVRKLCEMHDIEFD